MKKFYLNLEQYVSKTVVQLWTVLLVFAFGNSVSAQTTTVNLTTPGASTWTVPCGVTSLTVEAWGGGGAGGAATIIPSGGSGGGGGGYSSYVVTVTSGQIINYTIGSGAAGGIGNGGNGGTTTILALTANGGDGGGQNMGTVGAGGASTGGTTNTTGGNGTLGTTTTGQAGGNSTVAGTGGPAVIAESNGNNGIVPGGGGGGGLLLSGVGPSLGGNGADGQIKITYTQPVVIAPSLVTPSSAVSICSGKSTNLSATSAGNTINWYTVSTGGTTIGSSASAAFFSVSPTADTTYYAEAVSPAGCVSVTRTATALVTVNPLPATAIIATPSVPTNICNGSNINLNATSAGNQIYWYTAATAGTNLGNVPSGIDFLRTPTINSTTTYYADARNTTTGCFAATRTATGAITTSAPPTINTQPAITPSNTVCEGSGTRTITITASGVNTYQWRRNGVDLNNSATFSGVNTVTLTITNPATTDSGDYSVMLNGSTCGLVSNNATLTVNALPTPPSVTPNGAAVVVCTTNGSTPLNATSAGNTIYWYTVPTGGTSLGSVGSGGSFPVSAPTATIYYAESRNAATGCISSSRTATASVTSNVLPVITTQPAPTATACVGIGTIAINVVATGVTTFQWRKNGANFTIAPPYSTSVVGNTLTLTITNPPIGDNNATFDVVLNNANATCPVTSSLVTLTVNAIPSAPTAVTPSSAASFCDSSGTINLNATSAGNTIYWYTVATGGTSFGNSASGANLSVTSTSTVTYYAEARAAGCNSTTRTATATITVTQTPVPNIEFTEGRNDDNYTINICGHIATGENDIDVFSGNPNPVGGSNATSFSPGTGQWQVSYDNQVTWVDAPGPSSTKPQYIFEPAYTTFESVPGTYHFRLIITVNGCPGISDVITLTVVGNPTLTPGSVAGNQSSCTAPFDPAGFTQTAAAAVGTPIGGYGFSYQWQSSTDNINFTNITGATGTTYNVPAPGISVTTYYRRYAIYGSAGGGCSEVSNTITVLVGALAPPTVGLITQPTCTVATGDVELSSLPSGTSTINPGGITSTTTTKTLTGLAPGTYNFTVTAPGCASPSGPSANVVINPQPVTPATPVASTTAQPTCPTPKGTIVVTVPAPAANITYTLNKTTAPVSTVTQAVTTFPNLDPGAYSLTATNTTSGCTTTSIPLSVGPVPAPPPIAASVTVQPTCTVTTGTIVITSPAPAANVTYTLTGISPPVTAVPQGGVTFANLNPGTYSVTATNATTGCTSSVLTAGLTVNAVPLPPAVPTASVTVQPNCTVTTGTIVITAPVPAGNVTYTVTGTLPVVAAVTQGTTSFANLAPGNYSVTTTNSTTGCTSSALALTVNTIPANPALPTASVNPQPTCTTPTGTIVVTMPAPAANITYTVIGPSPAVTAVTHLGATFANLAPGDYSVKTTDTATGCVSGALGLTVNPQPTVPAVPSLTAGTITCNNATANWTTIPNVTGYRIDVARDNIFTDILPAYNDLLLGSGAATQNVTGLASGLTFYIRVRAENSCGPSNDSNIITITTGASPTAFSTTLVQPNCVTATGQITVNESAVDPADQYSFDDGVTYQASNTKNLLAAGTYKVRVKNTNGCETLATTVILDPATTTTYSSIGWSNGTPTPLTKAIFAYNYTLTGDLHACSCEVNSGTVTVNSGISLFLENGLDITGSGSIIFEDSSSLIQTNDVDNTGNITYKRNTTEVGKFDFTYWSSPVSPQTLLNLSPTTLSDKYVSWDAVNKVWIKETPGNTMKEGIGYAIRGPQGNLSPAVYNASFIGVPNNGSVPISIAGPGLDYLIGNPYPSALSADAFLEANPILDGTIYFWTHNTPITQSGAFYVYDSDDYASYNGVGGTATQAALNPGINESIPSGKIAAGQSFFTTSNAAGTVTFENTMRLGPVGEILDNSQFFKGTKTKSNISAIKKHRIWLNFSNTEGAFKQLLVGYVTDATNGLDNRFDGANMDSNSYVNFYSINDNKKFSIQGRALPFDIMDQVPLGFRTTIEGTFSINIDQVDGILASLPVYLEDKLTGTTVNLKNGAYSFTTAIGTFDDRFVLRYINSSIKISDYAHILNEINKKVLVSVKNHHIKINSFDQTIENVTIYDLSRRKLYERENINSNEFNVPSFSSTNQFLMVQIRLKNGKWVTEKIVF
ncbi:T9SS sorting signal type C domain-containing protein [Flavobacterium granuli]|uniref:Gliding motility-associated C-terminal domain-containing protein n=1 Tax=Flavobacterium granuli TaxID=280093 RepID=A0ABU1RYI6_9FLAO|nr:T9SS sorting signal type C domain-containing protein [Flavobacterium granuli]MDR6843821.1 hypothetical protein [Flavobacterium granuli]